MEFKYIKGSADDFTGAPDWAVFKASVKGRHEDEDYAYVSANDDKYKFRGEEYHFKFIGFPWGNEVKIIAQREPIEESIGYNLDCEGADSSHPECLKLNEPVKSNSVDDIATSIANAAYENDFMVKEKRMTDIQLLTSERDYYRFRCEKYKDELNSEKLRKENMNKVCGWLPEDCRGEDYLITDMKIECNDPITSGTIYAAKMTVEVEQKNKYIRQCKGVDIDVYDVLTAFNVTNPATAHAVKKLLCAGLRGAKDSKQDMLESIEAIKRAIKLTGEGVK